MSNSSQYEALYRDLVANIEDMHKSNVRKTSAALKSLLIIPTIFLIMLFLTSSSKSIFLVLWIASMFVIAGILIIIEYQDYKLQRMLTGVRDREAALPPHEETVEEAPHSRSPEMQKAEKIRQSIFSRAPVAPAEENAQEEPVPVSDEAACQSAAEDTVCAEKDAECESIDKQEADGDECDEAAESEKLVTK